MLSCETNQLLNVETKQILKSLLNTLRQKQSVKIILTTPSGGDTVSFLQDIAKETFLDGFVTKDEQLTWTDLTPSSQEKLLQKRVIFQGASIPLNELMSAVSPAANVLPLGALLEEKELTIADPVFITDAYNESYYIDRTLCLQKCVKVDIFTDKTRKDFPDSIASTEQEFKQFCQLNPNNNIHWLEKDKSGKIVWQQSQGSLETLRRYIDTEISQTFTAEHLDKLLEQAQHQRVMLISDTAGMGKSTLLTQLSKKIKQKFPTKWVVRIDINDHTDALNTLQQKHIDKEKAIEIVSENLLKFQPGVGLALFKQCCELKQKVRIIIMVDGFDEISPNYKETVIDLLQALRQTAVEQLWVTTRPHLREELEDNLQQLSYKIKSFSKENQVEFLKRFWCQKDWFTEVGNGSEEEFKTKLENYAEDLIRKLSQSISDRDKQFTGIPLQCRMLAEAFDKEVKTLYHVSEIVLELPLKLDLLGLYERFIERKYEICLEEKGKFSTTNVCAKEVRKELVKNIVKDHQLLALKVLFREEQVALLHTNSQCTSFNESLTRPGIVQISNEGKLHFIHRTFAEFYVGDYFVKELTKGSNISQQILDLLLCKICLEEQYPVLRVFIDGMLSRSEPSNEVIKQCGNRMHDLGKDGILTLHTTAGEGNANIMGFLLDSLEETEHRDTLVRLLLAQNDVRQTAWHMASEKGHIEVLNKLWQWAIEVLTQAELYKMFLAKDLNERTAWHMASENGQIEVLVKLWEWGKHVLTPEDLNSMFLGKDRNERTAWHIAAVEGQIEILHKLWDWAKDVLTRDELNKIFLSKDGDEYTAWHMASQKGQIEVLHKLWEWAKKVLTLEDLNSMFLGKDRIERTAWHIAADEGQMEVLHKLWEWGKAVLTKEELKSMFLHKDRYERTAWHIASEKGQIEILHKLWEWGKEIVTTEEFNNMFLAKDVYGKTAWHMAAEKGQIEVLQKQWELAKMLLTQEEFNNMLFLAKALWGSTAWHMASENGQVGILHKLWEWGKEILTHEELGKMFLARDVYAKTAWHMAAEKGQIEVLHNLWDWAKEVLTQEELNNLLFLTNDGFGRTAWHMASEKGKIEVLHKLWDWAKEILTPEELNNMFLAKDGYERTAWHMASEGGKVEVLYKLWEWGKEILTREELKKLFLDEDIWGRIAGYMAAEKGHTNVSRKLREWLKEVLSPEEISDMFIFMDLFN